MGIIFYLNYAASPSPFSTSLVELFDRQPSTSCVWQRFLDSLKKYNDFPFTSFFLYELENNNLIIIINILFTIGSYFGILFYTLSVK